MKALVYFNESSIMDKLAFDSGKKIMVDNLVEHAWISCLDLRVSIHNDDAEIEICRRAFDALNGEPSNCIVTMVGLLGRSMSIGDVVFIYQQDSDYGPSDFYLCNSFGWSRLLFDNNHVIVK